MPFRVVLDPRAETEAREAYLWYAARNPLAAARIAAELTKAVEDLAETALIWPDVEPGVQRRLLNKYPYGLIYRVRGEDIEVIAVMHLKRKPGYWRTRG